MPQREHLHPSSLAEEHRVITRARIVEAALAATRKHGLAATVDDIATAAGVGRRTVFRYFATRDELLAAAGTRLLAIYEEQVLRQGPAPGQELSEWLTEVATAIHRLHRDVLGRLFWDIHEVSPKLPPQVAAVIRQRRAARQQWTDAVARQAWRAVGGRKSAPRWVVDATSALLSSFTTNALAGDLERTPEEIGSVVARLLTLSFLAAADEQDDGD